MLLNVSVVVFFEQLVQRSLASEFKNSTRLLLVCVCVCVCLGVCVCCVRVRVLFR